MHRGVFLAGQWLGAPSSPLLRPFRKGLSQSFLKPDRNPRARQHRTVQFPDLHQAAGGCSCENTVGLEEIRRQEGLFHALQPQSGAQLENRTAGNPRQNPFGKRRGENTDTFDAE